MNRGLETLGDRRMRTPSNVEAPLIGMVKPTKRGAKSYEDLVALLPSEIRTSVRYAPIENGTMDEFAGAIPAYETMVLELAGEGADLIHA